MSPGPEYAPLSSDNPTHNDPSIQKEDWDEYIPDRSSFKKAARLPYLLSFFAGLLVGIALVFATKPAFTILANLHKSTPKTPSAAVTQYDVNKGIEWVISPKTGEAKCGNNWQEAKELGCHFDVMASRWYSDECFNKKLMDDMLTEVDFQWFEDPEHTKPITREMALSGEFEAVWPLHDFHIMHCLYLWRRLHSALVNHLHLDDDVYSFGHTLHCTRLIMQWPMEWKYGKNSTTIATSGRPYCRKEPL